MGQVIISFNGSVLWAVQRLCQSAWLAVGVYAAASLSASTGCPVALSTFLDALEKKNDANMVSYSQQSAIRNWKSGC